MPHISNEGRNRRKMITLSLDRTAFREWMKASRVPASEYALVFERLLQESAAM